MRPSRNAPFVIISLVNNGVYKRRTDKKREQLSRGEAGRKGGAGRKRRGERRRREKGEEKRREEKKEGNGEKGKVEGEDWREKSG